MERNSYYLYEQIIVIDGTRFLQDSQFYCKPYYGSNFNPVNQNSELARNFHNTAVSPLKHQDFIQHVKQIHHNDRASNSN